MDFDLGTGGDTDPFRLITHAVVPRPIAWVTSLGRNGVVNLAPFSYFGIVSDDPVRLMLSIGRRQGGLKDTARNLLERGEAVVHLVTPDRLDAMVATSAELAVDRSELELVGLGTEPSHRIETPRLAGAKVAIEVRVYRHEQLGNEPNDLFLLDAVSLFVEDSALSNGVPELERLGVVGKMGGPDYTITAGLVARQRP